ncbi:DUF2304 domain-containing protein [Paenibacillus turicensis]|jgi:hypothetical protein|uniref:DUF2304 domain-containing protein n=1 Tax=Paenibacillus turicensis TaxID=160487 RepID=UPI003D2B2269
MISFKFQIILIVGALFCFFALINLIRKYKLELRYSLLWMIVMLLILVLAIDPHLVGWVSKGMGVELPVNAVFFLTIFGLTVIVFSLTVTVSKLTTKIKELSQQLGIMQHHLNELKQHEQHKS